MDRLQQLARVLVAAQAALEAGEDQMLTRAEWDELEEAVAAARAPAPMASEPSADRNLTLD